MKKPTLKTNRRAFQVFIAAAFILIPIINRSRYSYVYGNFLSFHAVGIPFADPLAILQLSVKNFYLTVDNIIGAFLPLSLAFFLGTVFCSWICPFGLLSELTQGIRKKSFGKRHAKAPIARRGFPLKMTIFGTGFIGFFIFSTTPVLNQLSMPAWYARFFQYYFGQDFISLSILFILGLLIIEFALGRRIWCRYVCPQSLLITLVKQLNSKRLKVVFLREKCICKPGYDRCEEACSLSLHPKTLYESAELECSNCGDCVVACTKMGQALNFSTPWDGWRTRFQGRKMNWRRLFVVFPALAVLVALGVGGYQLATHRKPEPVVTKKANILLDNRIFSWTGDRANYYELLADGTLICVGGDWPVNGFKGGRWQAIDDKGSFKMILDPKHPKTYFRYVVQGHPAIGAHYTRTRFIDNVAVKSAPETFVCKRYEPLRQSHRDTATTMNATAVLTRYADEFYILDLRVQDPDEKIRKILTEGDAITNEGMLTSVKYWLNTPQIIVSEGRKPKLPIYTKMQILFLDGHEEPAEFRTRTIVDHRDQEFEDPWF